MNLYGEEPVWCGDECACCYAANFTYKEELSGAISNMLNNGIGPNNIKGGIGEREDRAIVANGMNRWVTRLELDWLMCAQCRQHVGEWIVLFDVVVGCAVFLFAKTDIQDTSIGIGRKFSDKETPLPVPVIFGNFICDRHT